MSQVKLIAEPWDVGEGGYQVGNFPPLWSEWNGRYRDTVRDFWRGRTGHLGEFAARLTGSSDLYEDDGRRPARQHQLRHRARRVHPGRPGHLRAQAQRGQRRGQPRRHRRQPLVELRGRGPHRRLPRCVELRARQRRNLLTTLLLCQGVPMLLAGDELGRTQQRQQQRLRPGQRDLLGRLGRRRRRSCSSSAGGWWRCAAPTRCCTGGASSPDAPVRRRRAARRRVVHARRASAMTSDDWDERPAQRGDVAQRRPRRVGPTGRAGRGTARCCVLSTSATRRSTGACPTGAWGRVASGAGHRDRGRARRAHGRRGRASATRSWRSMRLEPCRGAAEHRPAASAGGWAARRRSGPLRPAGRPAAVVVAVAASSASPKHVGRAGRRRGSSSIGPGRAPDRPAARAGR